MDEAAPPVGAAGHMESVILKQIAGTFTGEAEYYFYKTNFWCVPWVLKTVRRTRI